MELGQRDNVIFVMLGAADSKTPLQLMEPDQRAYVMMALLAFVVLGIGLGILVWLGGRWVQRINRRRTGDGPTGENLPSDWDPQPWEPRSDQAPDD